VLAVDDLSVAFRSGDKTFNAVRNLSLTVERGETLAIVGESGSGKSTTGRSLLRLVESQSGSIEFDGKEISSLTGPALQALRRDIQFI
jgi:glutathione transport system ATP-binding protein